MFMGEFTCKIDDKGRFMLPAKFREILQDDEFIITRGLDNSIDLFPDGEWSNIENELRKLKRTDSKHRAYQRFILSAATKLTVDKQGRVNLPNSLLEHAKINKSLIVTGMVDKIEIWAEEVWKEYIEKTESSIEDIVEEINFDF